MNENGQLLHECKKEDFIQEKPVNEENIYWDAMQEMVRQDDELQNSKRRLFGRVREDSAEMTSVKEAMADVTRFMFEAMPVQEDEFSQQLDLIMDKYKTLLTNCETYISNKKRRPFTSNGRERLRLVKGVYSLAKAESERFADSAWELHMNSAGQSVAWANVLGKARSTEINMDQLGEENISADRGAVNEVTVIRKNGTTKYFKDEEHNLPADEAFNEAFLDTQENKETYSALKSLTNEEQFFTNKQKNFQFILNKWHQKEINDDKLGAYLADICSESKQDLDWKDQSTQKALIEVIPKLYNWMNREYNCKIAKIGHGSPIAVRNVATSRFAHILNIPKIVAHSTTGTLKQKGKKLRTGNLMDKARGRQLDDIINESEKGQLEYTPEMVRELSTLQIFDTLCGQIDRHEDNYLVESVKEGGKMKLNRLQGIDNDMSFGTRSYDELKHFLRKSNGTPLGHLPSFENKEGVCTLPAIDKGLVTAINSIDDELLKYTFADLLSKEELNALISRFTGVRDAINRTVDKDKKVLVPSDKWNADVMRRFKNCTQTYLNKEYIPS